MAVENGVNTGTHVNQAATAQRYPIPPEQRCLVNAPQKRVWRLPDDYPQCVADRLLAAFPELRRAGTKRAP